MAALAANPFKRALTTRTRTIGLWLAMADAYSAELCASTGFQWALIDGEHAPNDLRSILAQLQALAAYPIAPVVRPPIGETWMIKQLLDIGARNLLIPMVETAGQARELVEAVRYPPRGRRGVGSSLARASGFNGIPDYLHKASDEIGLILQVESIAGLAAIEAICAIDGVDGIFVGPADLAADMGELGRPGSDSVRNAVSDAIARIVAGGKAAGVLTPDPSLARNYMDAGATFVAVGSDIGLLKQAASGLAAQFIPNEAS